MKFLNVLRTKPRRYRMDSEELENFVCYAEGDDDVPRTADCECNLGVVGRVSPGIGKCELLKVRYRARSPCFPFCWPLATSKLETYFFNFTIPIQIDIWNDHISI